MKPDWADDIEAKLLINAGVAHLDSFKARLGGAIANRLRQARAEALEEAAKVCERRFMGDHNREDMEARRCAAAIRALIPKAAK